MAVGRQYVRSLRRAGEANQAAGVLFRLGERIEACEVFGIRWEADAPQTYTGKRVTLHWRDQVLSLAEVLTMVRDDLARLDPERLAQSWPRTKKGTYRLSTAQALCRYQAHEFGLPHQRLTLLAWTPGAETLRHRPEDKGKRVITVSLEARSVRKALLKPSLWQRAR
jgi:hypothetical protein